MSRLQVGIIGCGDVARSRHLPEYRANPRAQVRSVCDEDGGRLAGAAREYGAVAYRDYRELLADPEVEAVSVCLPFALHADVTLAALQAGKHVLCEKPMASTLEAARAMAQTAEDTGCTLMIGFHQRFLRAHQTAKEWLHSGRLGAVLRFRFAYGHGGPERLARTGAPIWRLHGEEAQFGPLGDLGLHKFDVLRWLLEDEVAGVMAVASRLERPDAPDNVVSLIELRSGAVGTVAASWTHRPGEEDSATLYCERGIVQIELAGPHCVTVYHEDGSAESLKDVLEDDDTNGASGVIDEFVDALFSGRESAIPGREGVASQAVAMAALESARTGCKVRL